MSGEWVQLDAEAIEHLNNDELHPLHMRETRDGVEVRTEHVFPRNPRLQRRCEVCGLLPLEYDSIEYECGGRYGVRDEYEPRFGRQRLTLWSGSLSSDYEGVAIELPGHNGYMIELEYVAGKKRVECPSPRTDENYAEVDEAIQYAAQRHAVDARMSA